MTSSFLRIFQILILASLVPSVANAQDATTLNEVTENTELQDRQKLDEIRWQVSKPLLSVDPKRLPASVEHPWLAIKDPSVVKYDGAWHLFCTLRKDKQGDGRIRIGYQSFDDWDAAPQSTWRLLDLTMEYHGAPQIFYFKPHKKWYLVYQAADSSRGLKYGPCFSTNDDISDPERWTLPQPIYKVKDGAKAGLDFWVICDKSKAHLFFTTLDGRMWRAETALEDFPNENWTQPKVVLKADIFEASHTYKIAGEERYFTIVEAKSKNRRYFKGYVADTLDGRWDPVGPDSNELLVTPDKVVNQNESWATSYSHGEFIRVGVDQEMEIDLSHPELIFQGANDQEYQRGSYGQIPWRLGRLKGIR